MTCDDQPVSPGQGWRDAAGDLVLGGTCAGCGRAGRRLCEECRGRCVARPRRAAPRPLPPALADPPVLLVAAGAYDGVLAELVVGFKEHQRLGLVGVLGRLLGSSVAAAMHELGLPAATLVPVPSAGRAVRARGHDAVASLAGRAASELRRGGVDAVVSRALCQVRGVRDQHDLGASGRALNLHGGLRWRPGAAGDPRLRRPVLVVDDVVTTGSSLAEAVRVLRTRGVWVPAGATVAATRRRTAVASAAGALP